MKPRRLYKAIKGMQREEGASEPDEGGVQGLEDQGPPDADEDGGPEAL